MHFQAIFAVLILFQGEAGNTQETTTIPPFVSPGYTELPNPELNPTREEILEQHNIYRRLHGVDDMTLDEDVSIFAQEWAEYLANDVGGMMHRSGDTQIYGENIYWTSSSSLSSGSSPVSSWYSEISDYDFDNPGFSSATGHFTQVVWAASVRLGCGIQSTDGGGTYVVCNYDLSGNVGGQFEANVQPLVAATTQAPVSTSEGQTSATTTGTDTDPRDDFIRCKSLPADTVSCQKFGYCLTPDTIISSQLCQSYCTCSANKNGTKAKLKCKKLAAKNPLKATCEQCALSATDCPMLMVEALATCLASVDGSALDVGRLLKKKDDKKLQDNCA